MTGTHVFILRDIRRKITYAACFSVTPARGLVDFIVNLIFCRYFRERGMCCRTGNIFKKKFKTQDFENKNFKEISKEMSWAEFEHVAHVSS